MASSLVPCPSCARHVRATERACPFCRTALSASIASRVIPGATQRLSRAAAFTFAASLAATGCSDDPAPAADAAVVDTGSTTDSGTAPTRARPPTRAPTTDTGLTDAGFPSDDGGIVAMYGGPPDTGVDSGADSGGPSDDGGIAPLYGLPADAGQPSQDAGPDGSMILRYGSPPRPDAGV
jgi:hypothetical protein